MRDIPELFNLADYYLFERLNEGRGDRIGLRFGERAWSYQAVAHRSIEQYLFTVLPPH